MIGLMTAPLPLTVVLSFNRFSYGSSLDGVGLGNYRQLSGSAEILLVAVSSAVNQPFTIWLLRNFFLAVPEELEESAMVDGCTRFGALRRVILPLAGHGLVTAGVFTLFVAYQEYLIPVVLTQTRDRDPAGLHRPVLDRYRGLAGDIRGRHVAGTAGGRARAHRAALPRRRAHDRLGQGVTGSVRAPDGSPGSKGAHALLQAH